MTTKLASLIIALSLPAISHSAEPLNLPIKEGSEYILSVSNEKSPLFNSTNTIFKIIKVYSYPWVEVEKIWTPMVQIRDGKKIDPPEPSRERIFLNLNQIETIRPATPSK